MGPVRAAAASIHPLRLALTPRLLPAALSGQRTDDRVALTFDDGPDPATTPHFLDLLAAHGVRATFFLLGEHAHRHPDLVRRIAEHHEVAVHGWTHRCVAFIGAGRLRSQLASTKRILEDLTGQEVHWYRPPYGVITPAAERAGRAVGLEPVLWSAWGRDWERRATPESVLRTLDRTLAPGGTILLHDTDRTAAPGSWRTTLAATERLLTASADRLTPLGRPVG